MDYSIIERAALGRVANIGDLYDAVSESFVGRSLFEKHPQTEFRNCQAETTEFVLSGSFLEKAEKMKIQPELQISLLAGLVSLSGAGDFLKHEKQSRKAVHCSLICSVCKKIDKVYLFCRDIGKLIDRYALYCRPTEVTHVVAEIHWGATSVVTLEHPNESNSDQVKIVQDLLAALNNAAFCSDTDMLDHCKVDNKSVSIHTFADVCLPKTRLKSCNGKREMLNKIREGIAVTDDCKGMPQKYVLVPLCRVRSYLKIVYVSVGDLVLINERPIARISKLHENLIKIKQEVHDLRENLKAFQVCTTEKDMKTLEEASSDIELLHRDLELQLQEVLVCVRRGTKDAKELDIMENKIGVHVQSFVKSFVIVKEQLHKIPAKMTFVNFLTKNKITFVGRDLPFDHTLMSAVEELYILFYSEDEKQANTTLWNDNINLFLDRVHSRNKDSNPDKLSNEKPCHTMFVVVDTDLRPEIVTGFQNTKAIHISLYKNGVCVDEDVLQSHVARQNSGFVRYTKQLERVNNPPVSKVVWSVACPGSVSGQCSKKELTWFCENCNELLEHCSDDNVYCKCDGNACGLKSNYIFQCNDGKHGQGYIRFKDTHPGKLTTAKELNILVLGETGVGKSTWINAIANYLSFSSLEDAKEHDLMCLIGTSFTVMDDNFEEKVVRIGEDSNEELKVGQSATKSPKAYSFQWNDVNVRLIDTPGIGDTRGMQQDAANFDKVLQFIAGFKELHGICILLKPNNARLGVMFRFCIKELLTYLHHSCSQNIAFCFTNARNTLYRPGDTFPALKTLLSNNEVVKIALSKDNIYCFDNESFRCLCMFHNSVESDESQVDLYSTSWNRSVAETKRLFEHFICLNAHKVQDTVSLNDTRRILFNLTKPIASIGQNILANMALVEERKLEVMHSVDKISSLSKKLCVPTIVIEPIPLGYPRTVCTSPTCVVYHTIGEAGFQTTEYVTHCHDRCYLSGTSSEAYPNPQLMNCAVMDGGHCRRCGCPWQTHIHITYEQQLRYCEVIDATVETNLKSAKSEKECVELFVKDMEGRQKQLQDEKDKIMNACVKFGAFLSSNSMVQYGDAFAEHLATVVKQETDKCKHGGDRRVLEGLEKMHCQYLQRADTLKTSMNGDDTSKLSPVEMHHLVEELCALPLTGGELKQHMLVVGKTTNDASSYNETHCPPASKSKKCPKGMPKEMVCLPKDVQAKKRKAVVSRVLPADDDKFETNIRGAELLANNETTSKLLPFDRHQDKDELCTHQRKDDGVQNLQTDPTTIKGGTTHEVLTLPDTKSEKPIGVSVIQEETPLLTLVNPQDQSNPPHVASGTPTFAQTEQKVDKTKGKKWWRLGF